MAWGDINDLRRNTRSDRHFDELSRSFAADETPRLAVTAMAFYDLKWKLHDFVTLLLTTHRLLVLEEGGIFKKLGAVHEFPIGDFEGYGLSGVGENWVIDMNLRSGRIRFHVQSKPEADTLNEYINSGVAMWRAR